MTDAHNVEERISLWLEEDAMRHFPNHLLKATYEQTRKSRQQVGWRGVLAGLSVPRLVPALGGTAILLVVASLALNFVGLGGPAADPRTPFLGTWISTSDSDGGTQSMTVRRLGDNAVDIVVTDANATVCADTPSTMTGVGSADGDRMVIPTPDYRCDDGSEPQLVSEEVTPLNEFLRNLTYVRDPERDILVVAGTDVWHRPNAPLLTPDPNAEPMAEMSPIPSQSLRPSRRPGDATFTSAIHGISIDYTSGWQTRPATEPWTGDPLGFDSPAADVIFDPALGDKVYLLMASIPWGGVRPPYGIKGDWPTDLEWLCQGGPAGSWNVDGVHAWVQECAAPSGANNIALVYADERGYVIQLRVTSDAVALVESYGWDGLKGLLETVDLRPEEALDAPTASSNPSFETPTSAP